MRNLFLTNTLTRRKELFVPIHPGHVGMYVCGPTVYGDAHLGHARPGVTYDVLFRLLKHLGYKVRYVRNITDVGHLEHDADEGEDKIAKKAKLEDLEPMEVVQTYTERYHEAMRLLNVESPSIEPRASGHIIEQIETGFRLRRAVGPDPGGDPGRDAHPGRPVRQARPVRLRHLEEGRAGAHHALAVPVGRRLPGLAP